jgi:hypothetical protein
MNRISCWVPAMFCGAISLIAIGTLFVAPNTDAFSPVFLCFLPMCFVFVGVAMADMQREIRSLKVQLASQALRRHSASDEVASPVVPPQLDQP